METNFNDLTVFLPFLFVAITQLAKNIDPEWFSKVSKWVILGLSVFGVGLNIVWYMAENSPVAVANGWEFTQLMLVVGVQGLMYGLSAVGLYEGANAAGVLKSARDLNGE